MLRILSKTAAAVTLLFALSACYVTQTSVLPASQATEVPGLEGTWTAVDGSAEDTITVARAASGNEYTLSAPQEDQTLTLRGMQLVDDVYLIEISDPNAPSEGAILAFVQVQGDSLSVLTPTGNPEQLAGQAGVQLGDDGVEVSGEPAAVLQFVQLHADAAFNPQPMLTRVD